MHVCARVCVCERESFRLGGTEISAACANRNFVNENVRIVIPQMHTLNVTLAALARTVCHAATLRTHRRV